jgi:hypothetical protein
VSQFPRRVLNLVLVPWGEPGCSFLVLPGALVDVKPGTALETAYGASNLSGVLSLAATDPQNNDKSALTNQ